MMVNQAIRVFPAARQRRRHEPQSVALLAEKPVAIWTESPNPPAAFRTDVGFKVRHTSTDVESVHQNEWAGDFTFALVETCR